MKEIEGMGKGVKIVVIDSGVDISHPQLCNYKFNGITLTECENGIMYDKEKFDDQLGHGTAVSYLIKKIATCAELFIVKIFEDKESDTSLDLLSSAIEYAVKVVRPDIIHLSNGVTECSDIVGLHNAIKQAADKGIILVSAFDNMGAISYPAAFPEVIGVDRSKECTKLFEYMYVHDERLNILGFGLEQRLPWCNGSYQQVGGSSFVAPIITGYIANLIENGYKSVNEIKDKLEEYAREVHIVKKGKPIQYPDKIKKAITFPFNKEIRTIARTENMLDFEIVDYYDFRLSKNVGKKISSLVACENEKVVKNYSNINWESDFDTLIIGHLFEMNLYTNHDFIEELIKLCILHKKNIYAFDDLSKYKNDFFKDSSGVSIFSPAFNRDNIPGNPKKKLRRFGVPVVCIAGTSSQQGKFTLQLMLRKIMLERGYRVGQLGTEPSSLLYGMDEVLPIGYGSEHMKFTPEEMAYAANMLMGKIEDKAPELILYGLQSHILPLAMGNIGFYPMYDQSILLATEPDAIILCVNLSDELTYIHKTICYLESVVETKVICLVISPLKKQEINTIFGIRDVVYDVSYVTEKRKVLEKEFCIPVYEMKTEVQTVEIVECLEDFFSGSN